MDGADRARLPAFLILLATAVACSGISPAAPSSPTVVATAIAPPTQTVAPGLTLTASPTPSPTPSWTATVVNTLTPTPGATSGTAAYLGQFDCNGTESGLLAYSGRITIDANGSVAFKDYDGSTQTGQWTYARATTDNTAFTFTGNIALASATYDPKAGTLRVVVSPGKKVVHAEDGTMACERAVPGKTGPP